MSLIEEYIADLDTSSPVHQTGIIAMKMTLCQDSACAVKIARLDCCNVLLQRGSSMMHSPEQLPAPLTVSTPHNQSNRDAVTPQASLQAPGTGTGTSLPLSGHIKQHSLASALARAAGISSSVPRADPETRAGLGADDRHGPSTAGRKDFGWNGPLAAEATQALDVSPGFQLSGSHTAALESARQSSRAGPQLYDRHAAADTAAAGRQDDVRSSASFDSWNSKQRSHSGATASTSHAAHHTAVHPGLSPAAVGAAEAVATTAASAQLAGPIMSATSLTSQAATAAGEIAHEQAVSRSRDAQRARPPVLLSHCGQEHAGVAWQDTNTCKVALQNHPCLDPA